MRPTLSIDVKQIAANARAWREFARVPVRAVVKADGYGWGLETIVSALGDSVQSFCVADLDELHGLRAVSDASAIVLGAVPLADLREVLEANALPTISTGEELQVAADFARAHSARLRVRVGVRTAAAWSGLGMHELATFAAKLKAASAEVEAWTHITDLAEAQSQLQQFEKALGVLSQAGVNVAATDICSTFPLASGIRGGSSVRIGVGLFGATGGPSVPGVSCALRFSAPVLRTERHSAGTRIGYGGTMLGMDRTVAVLRGGFADGVPASLQGKGGVLMVGMQYAAVDAAALPRDGDAFVWLDRSSSLDEFAQTAGRPVHEIITGLGHASARA
jgi:alanine racemase